MIKHNEPIIFNAKPMYVIFTRPNLSAISPAPTINSPENNAVKLMAMLIVPMSVLNEDCNVGTTLTNDCANNQNVSTPIIIPISNLLSP